MCSENNSERLNERQSAWITQTCKHARPSRSHSYSFDAVTYVWLSLSPSIRCNSRLCAKYECLVFANLLLLLVLVANFNVFFSLWHFHFTSFVWSYVYTFVRSFRSVHAYIREMRGIQLDLVNSFLFILLLLFNGRQNHYKQCNTYSRMYVDGRNVPSSVFLFFLLFFFFKLQPFKS